MSGPEERRTDSSFSNFVNDYSDNFFDIGSSQLRIITVPAATNLTVNVNGNGIRFPDSSGQNGGAAFSVEIGFNGNISPNSFEWRDNKTAPVIVPDIPDGFVFTQFDVFNNSGVDAVSLRLHIFELNSTAILLNAIKRLGALRS